MDWKIYFTTFAAVFAAELADKTQLVGIGLSAKTGKPLTVWMGSVSAYLIITALSVIFGAAAAKYLRPDIIRYTAGSVFIVIGILALLGKF